MSKLILASGSEARQTMMRNAGVVFDVVPADIDEEAVQDSGNNPTSISMLLSMKKALAVSIKYPEKYIIGSDQVLSMKNIIYSKAKSKKEARERLSAFSGSEHMLTSSVAVVKNSKLIFDYTDTAYLKMKTLSEEKIDTYIASAGDVLTQCVGCYAIEERGITLFEEIKGDYFTILGMPLLPLLNFLDMEGLL